MYVNLRHKESHGSSCLILHHAWKVTLDESGREIFCWLRNCETAWWLTFVTSKKVNSNRWKILVWHKTSQSISIYNKNLVEKNIYFSTYRNNPLNFFFLNNENVFLIIQHILNSPLINDFGTIENINQFNKLLLNHRTLTGNKIFLNHFCPLRLSIHVLIKNSLKFQLEGNENRFVCKDLSLWRKSAF